MIYHKRKNLCYALRMEKPIITPAEMAEFCQESLTLTWAKALRLWPDLSRQTMPRLKYNKRLKTTAGRAWYDTNEIELSNALLWEHPRAFYVVIIPHELAHHIAKHIYSDEGHGPAWKSVMITLGLPPDTYHNLQNSQWEKRKAQIANAKNR